MRAQGSGHRVLVPLLGGVMGGLFEGSGLRAQGF